MRSSAAITCRLPSRWRFNISQLLTFQYLPVVDARVVGVAGIRHDDPPVQLPGVDRQGAAAHPAGAHLQAGDAAVHRRPVVLAAGRGANNLRFKVQRQRNHFLGRIGAVQPCRERAAKRDVERRRPGQTGADRGLRAGDHRQPVDLKIAQQPGDETRFFSAGERGCVRRPQHGAGVLGGDVYAFDPLVRELALRPHGDGGVEGPGAFVEEVERPDVEGPAGQIEPCRGG